MSKIRVRYSTIEYPDFDIHVRSLWDRNQFSDDDGVALAAGISSATWPLFGTLWPAGHVLARIAAVGEFQGLRILEVGCGLALPSLVLNQRGLDITASDHHPEVEGFLQANCALNAGAPIPFVRTAWRDDAPELGRFDLVIGADLLYERHQVEDLAGFLRRHCKVGGKVVIVDPGRASRGRFTKRMLVLGFNFESRAATPLETPDDAPRAHVLIFVLGGDRAG